MDRFIGQQLTLTSMWILDLKSNMDRFIEWSEFNFVWKL